MATISQALAIAMEQHQAGRLAAAEEIYRRILAAEPNHAHALHLLGVTAHQRGEHETAIDYITKLDVSVTPLTAFDAAYTTKGGFRIAALGTRRTGVIQFGVRDARSLSTPVVFSRDEMSRLSGLINQAKGVLDSVRR